MQQAKLGLLRKQVNDQAIAFGIRKPIMGYTACVIAIQLDVIGFLSLRAKGEC